MSHREQEQGVWSSRSDSRTAWKPDLGVHHGDQLVARAVSLRLESRDHDAQILLERLVRAEGQPPYPRVQTVGTHDQIEVTGAPALELDPDPLSVVRERLHGVVQDQLSPAVERVVDHRSQIGPGDAHIPLASPP